MLAVMSDTPARLWFGGTALLVLIALVTQFVVLLTGPGLVNPNSNTALFRAMNMLAYFTILSNTIVGVTSLLLALNPYRRSTVFCVFRLMGLVAITITFIVYGVALAHLLDLDSWAYFSDVLLHRIVPVVAVLGPAGYMVFALIRGAIDRWYPYPFADVNSLGYGRVIVNAVWISVLFFAFVMGAHALDQALPRRGVGERPPAPASS